MTDLPYDYEDLGKDIQELQAKYGEQGSHPEYSVAEYRRLTEEAQGAFNGYWDWVLQHIAEDDQSF
jgi:hypothetical protein